MKLVAFTVVCSELCAHRLRKSTSGEWQFQRLALWLGAEAFKQYEDLVATYWTSSKLRTADLPNLLHALAVLPRPTVVGIRPGIEAIIREAREATAELDVLWMLPECSDHVVGIERAAVGAEFPRRVLSI